MIKGKVALKVFNAKIINLEKTVLPKINPTINEGQAERIVDGSASAEEVHHVQVLGNTVGWGSVSKAAGVEL